MAIALGNMSQTANSRATPGAGLGVPAMGRPSASWPCTAPGKSIAARTDDGIGAVALGDPDLRQHQVARRAARRVVVDWRRPGS